MTTFAFTDVNDICEKAVLALRCCQYCEARLNKLSFAHTKWQGSDVDGTSTLWGCQRCGWWHAEAALDDLQAASIRGNDGTEWALAGYAALRNLDLNDIQLPIQEVRDYLSARFEKHRELHPRLLELTVGSVFRDLGYESEVTAYSADGGVDVVLRSRLGEVIGVQVKQTKQSIEAEQIRAFTGALFLGGFVRGVYVALSRYRRGAERTADLSGSLGLPVELVDADRFLQILIEAQEAAPRFTEQWVQQRVEKLHIVDYEEYPWRPGCPS